MVIASIYIGDFIGRHSVTRIIGYGTAILCALVVAVGFFSCTVSSEGLESSKVKAALKMKKILKQRFVGGRDFDALWKKYPREAGECLGV
jgi:hypothetical protein